MLHFFQRLIFRSATEKILFNTDKMSPIRLKAYSEPYQTSKIELFAPLSTSFLSDFNLPSFVKPLSISFEVICQFSKKDIRAYSNITIASVISFPYYESAEAFLSKDPTVSKMEFFGTLVNGFQSLLFPYY